MAFVEQYLSLLRPKVMFYRLLQQGFFHKTFERDPRRLALRYWLLTGAARDKLSGQPVKSGTSCCSFFCFVSFKYSLQSRFLC